MTDPFGRALRDFHRNEYDDPLIQRDGEWAREHPVEAFYFGEFDESEPRSRFLNEWLDGPTLDMGAGAGRDALYFQEQFETVAIEHSAHLVETMTARGVEDARRADMFALPDSFETDRFQSAYAWGTQVELAASMADLADFLDDLAQVTTPDGTAVIDLHDPAAIESGKMLGYRSDPTSGLAHRVMEFEYGGDVGDILLFRLFGPDRLREAVADTDWRVAEIEYTNEVHYLAALEKSD